MDAEDGEAGEPLATASFGYLRLRRPGYERADLAAWAQRVAARDWDEAFVFFKHEDEAAGPALATSFLELAERAGQRKGPLPAAKKQPEDSRQAG